MRTFKLSCALAISLGLAGCTGSPKVSAVVSACTSSRPLLLSRSLSMLEAEWVDRELHISLIAGGNCGASLTGEAFVKGGDIALRIQEKPGDAVARCSCEFPVKFVISNIEKRPYLIHYGDRTLAMGTERRMNDVCNEKLPLLLKIVPTGGNVLITANAKPVENSGGRFKVPDDQGPVVCVPVDSPLDLAIEAKGFKTFHWKPLTEDVRATQTSPWAKEVALEPLDFGYLTIPTTPAADARIRIGESVWNYKAPIQDIQVPAGTHEVELINELLGMRAVIPKVLIKKGKRTLLPQPELSMMP